MPKAYAVCSLALLGISACAPAPLYTSSGIHKGAVTYGEIPRDTNGEPVWAAIRPAPVAAQPEAYSATVPAAQQEGDAEDVPTPPKA